MVAQSLATSVILVVRQDKDMGFAVAYQTTEQISLALQREMIDAANDMSNGRTWLSCEPPSLMNENGTLVGASKPNFSPHLMTLLPPNRRVFPMER